MFAKQQHGNPMGLNVPKDSLPMFHDINHICKFCTPFGIVEEVSVQVLQHILHLINNRQPTQGLNNQISTMAHAMNPNEERSLLFLNV